MNSEFTRFCSVVSDLNERRTITREKLSAMCWKAGYRGVTGVAKAIGKSRVTVHQAVNHPQTYSPTMKKLRKVLL